MKVIAEIRAFDERNIPGRDGKPDWKKYVLVVEHAEPLSLDEIEIGRDFENALSHLRGLEGKTCLIPMARFERRSGDRLFAAWRLTGLPSPVAATAQQPRAA